MAAWDDEDSDSSPAPVVRKGKFDDEEEEDILDDWEAAEDSEVEREKAKKAADAKAKAEAEARANHKSKSQRVEEKRMENMRRRQEDEDASSDEEESDGEKRRRLLKEQKEADLKNAEDLFAGIGVNPNRGAPKPVMLTDASNPAAAIELGSLPLFNPSTRDEFLELRETLVPLLANNAKKAQYVTFMQEFVKQVVKDLQSDQIKKIASGLTTLSNEKMKEEKAADKGGKKSKAQKTKTTLSVGRDATVRADTTSYNDGGLEDDDFM